MKLYQWPAIYWLVLALCINLTSCSDAVRETSLKRFMQMAKDGEVERVTIVDGQLVEVFLTPEALTRTKYQSLFGDNSHLDKVKPHLELHIVSEEAFIKELKEVQATFPITIK